MAFAMFISVGCFAESQGQTGSDKPPEGPSMPGGNSSEWAYKVKNARGPTGHCDDPNPRPDKDPKGIIISLHTKEPEGPDGSSDKGPRGMSSEYYAALTNDHFAGPAGTS
jgi:hypothetical protein